ncbi:MAG: TlpA disulfide reductase family protein [Gammaproteobacteria bacterium]|nr:TlpA disulfide reductase family protein [Gammaproteobacteria bacterium]
MIPLKTALPGALLACLLLVTAQATAAERTMDPESGRPMAGDFVLGSVSGDDYRLEDLRGQWVLVSFWATWCSPCLKEMPTMERLYQDMADEGLEILAVHAGPGGAKVGEFLEQVPVSFPILLDEDLSLGGWEVMALPTAVLVDPTGRQVYRAVGPRDWDTPAMKAFLRDLMAAPDAG